MLFTPEPTRFVPLQQMMEIVGYTNPHLKRLEAKGLFPKRVHLGGGRPAWILAEYEAWVASLAAKRGKAA